MSLSNKTVPIVGALFGSREERSRSWYNHNNECASHTSKKVLLLQLSGWIQQADDMDTAG